MKKYGPLFNEVRLSKKKIQIKNGSVKTLEASGSGRKTEIMQSDFVQRKIVFSAISSARETAPDD